VNAAAAACCLQPVCRPRRANSARLLVLADASASMDPWRPFLATLADSLRLGRLASAELRYFSNLPRRQLFADADLSDPQPRDEVLRRHAGAGLLVVSDAGSARGYLNRRRALQTAAFLAEAASVFPAIVWLNPMPRTRWAGTTAALVAAGSNVACCRSMPRTCCVPSTSCAATSSRSPCLTPPPSANARSKSAKPTPRSNSTPPTTAAMRCCS
jgi:uncharacterized protein with von Willebrand factor type A (vWA) domain